MSYPSHGFGDAKCSSGEGFGHVHLGLARASQHWRAFDLVVLRRCDTLLILKRLSFQSEWQVELCWLR